MKSIIFVVVRTFGKILATTFLFLAGVLRVSAATEDVTVRFRFGKADADLSKLEAVLSGPDASNITSIELKASSSPDGPYWVNKQLAQDRLARVTNKVKELCPSIREEAISSKVVAEDWAGVAKWLRRSGKAYKDEALKIVNETPAGEREEKLQDLWAGEAWDDLMRSAFPALRAVKITISYAPKVTLEVSAEEKSAESTVSSGCVKIVFAAGMRYVQPELGGNAAALADIAKMIESGKSLRIESWTSPEGDPVSNRTLAENRLKQVVKYLKENYALPEGSASSEVKGEDWAGLLREAEIGYQENNRDKVLEILGNDALSGGAKKAAIRGLDGSASWKHLIDNQMPALRVVTISNVSKAEAE